MSIGDPGKLNGAEAPQSGASTGGLTGVLARGRSNVGLQKQSTKLTLNEVTNSMAGKGLFGLDLHQLFEIRTQHGDISRFRPTDCDGSTVTRKVWAENDPRTRCIQVCVLCIAVWSVPFVCWRAAFHKVTCSPEGSCFEVDVLHMVLSGLYFVLVLVQHFNVSCIDDGLMCELFKPIAVAKHQVRRPQIWIDIVSCMDLPHQIYALATSSSVNIFSLLLQLFRIRQLIQTPSFLGYYNLFKILRLVVITFFTGHFCACLWWILLSSHDTFPEHVELTHFEQGQDVNEYIYVLFLAMQTVLARGPRALNGAEMAMASVVGILGTLLMAIVFGQMNGLVQSRNQLDSSHFEKVQSVKQALKNIAVPHSLRHRVIKYHEYIDGCHNDHASDSLFERLSGPLALELKLNIYHSLVTRAPFFQHASTEVIKNIVVSLQDAIYLPGDYVIRKGDVGREMFFIFRGTVEVVSAERVGVASLTAGLYFGEVALLTDRRRGAWVEAVSYCILAVLSKDDLDVILEDFPQALTALFRRMQEICHVSASISVDELRDRIFERFTSLDNAFQKMDVDNKLEIGILDFQRFVRRLGVDKTDAKLLFALIDKEGQTMLNLEAFKKGLQGNGDRTSRRPSGASRRPSSREATEEGGNEASNRQSKPAPRISVIQPSMPVAPTSTELQQSSALVTSSSQAAEPDLNDSAPPPAQVEPTTPATPATPASPVSYKQGTRQSLLGSGVYTGGRMSLLSPNKPMVDSSSQKTDTDSVRRSSLNVPGLEASNSGVSIRRGSDASLTSSRRGSKESQESNRDATRQSMQKRLSTCSVTSNNAIDRKSVV